MSISAKLNYLRIAPRKVRLVADLIRGKKVEEAQAILNFTQKRASEPLLKLLKSAIANAKHNFQIEESNLYIPKITVDEGPKLKRWRPRARGQAYEIQKKTSHITLVLDELVAEPKKKIKKKEVEKQVKEKPELEKKAEVREKEMPEPQRKPAIKPQREFKRPDIKRGIKRIFRRKAF